MKIEEGKYYRTRNGRKVGPAEHLGTSTSFPWNVPGNHFYAYTEDGKSCLGVSNDDLIAEWVDEPRLWIDLTDAEKGAFLLAHHEGKEIEFLSNDSWYTACDFNPKKYPLLRYRIKPKPKRETVTITSWGTCNQWMRNGDLSSVHDSHGKYCITFDMIDGKPDHDSIKMETIK